MPINETSIYEIRERGQVVNAGCQWIAEHRKLAMSLAVRPILILTAIEIVNILFVKSILLSLIIALIGLLFVPTVPSMMMYVVENAEEYDYPNRQPKLLELWSLWKGYLASALCIGIIGFVAAFLCSITVAGPIFIEVMQSIVLVHHHRNMDDGILTAISRAFTLSFANFPSLLFMLLGTCIITFAMVFGPCSFAFLFFEFISSVIPHSVMEMLNKMMDTEAYVTLGITIVVVGYFFSTMISIIVAHFYYGHCIACENRREAIKREKRRMREAVHNS
jgi:hypothetical protein